LSQFKVGWQILDKALLNKGHKTDLRHVLEALEALSCFDAWTRLDKYWKLSQQKKYSRQAQESMSTMLKMIHDRLPRDSGNGWKLPTFHNTMHIVNDMCKYGKPKESNTEVGEKNHKFFAKRIGRRCRKQHKTFSTQVALRLADSFVIDKLASAMGLLQDENEEQILIDNDDEKHDKVSTYGGTHCSLQLNGSSLQKEWHSSTEKHLLNFDDAVASFIKDHYMLTENRSVINCCTEYKHNKTFIRSHPCYQGEGSWFDWVNVHFEAGKVKKKNLRLESIHAKC
jgi:hypothetical protein